MFPVSKIAQQPTQSPGAYTENRLQNALKI